ncbi:MAG TPA: hypothetical protein VH682_29480 [Gemmataceae bacterium]
MIGLDGQTTTALVAVGQPVLAPILCRGLIDTGTDITSVASKVLRRLGLNTPTVQATTQTVRGSAPVDLFEVSVNVLDLGNPSRPKFVLPTLRIMELPTPLSNLDVLIGLDMLLRARLLLDGPGRIFTLDF